MHITCSKIETKKQFPFMYKQRGPTLSNQLQEIIGECGCAVLNYTRSNKLTDWSVDIG